MPHSDLELSVMTIGFFHDLRATYSTLRGMPALPLSAAWYQVGLPRP